MKSRAVSATNSVAAGEISQAGKEKLEVTKRRLARKSQNRRRYRQLRLRATLVRPGGERQELMLQGGESNGDTHHDFTSDH